MKSFGAEHSTTRRLIEFTEMSTPPDQAAVYVDSAALQPHFDEDAERRCQYPWLDAAWNVYLPKLVSMTSYRKAGRTLATEQTSGI